MNRLVFFFIVALVTAIRAQQLQTFDYETYLQQEVEEEESKAQQEEKNDERSRLRQLQGSRPVPARGGSFSAGGAPPPPRANTPPRGSSGPPNVGGMNSGGSNGMNSGSNGGSGGIFANSGGILNMGGGANSGGSNGGGGGGSFGGGSFTPPMGGSNGGGNSGGFFIRGGSSGQPGPQPAGPKPAPQPQPAPAPSPPSGSLDQQWLNEHNKRRTAFYKLFPSDWNVYDVPLKWSNSVARSAQEYADILIKKNGCKIAHKVNNNVYGGENLAANWGNNVERTPAQIMKAWYEEEIDLNRMQLVGQKYHASQVIWRSSKYLGCAHASKPHKDGTCFIQVCRYIQGGNCFLEGNVNKYPQLAEEYFPPGCRDKYRNNDWVCSTLGEKTGEACQNKNNPKCPKEGCK